MSKHHIYESSKMISYTHYFEFETKTRRALLNITDDLEDLVGKSRVQDGFCLVSAMHITAGIWVNDEESGLKKDLAAWLEQLAPFKADYLHHQTGEDNGDAHLKRTLIHHQALLPVTQGKLDLGPWEQVFYAEFDGQRKKRVLAKVTGLV